MKIRLAKRDIRHKLHSQFQFDCHKNWQKTLHSRNISKINPEMRLGQQEPEKMQGSVCCSDDTIVSCHNNNNNNGGTLTCSPCMYLLP